MNLVIETPSELSNRQILDIHNKLKLFVKLTPKIKKFKTVDLYFYYFHLDIFDESQAESIISIIDDVVVDDWNVFFKDSVENIDEIDEVTDENISYDVLTKELSKFLHEERCDLMIKCGWKWGEQFDENAKTSPDLLPWEHVSYKDSVINYAIVEEFLRVLEELNFEIVKK